MAIYDDVSARRGVLHDRSQADQLFRAACRQIEVGELSRAYQIFDWLGHPLSGVPIEIAEAAGIVKDIVDPRNLPEEFVAKFGELVGPRLIHVWDQEHGWSPEGRRLLAGVPG